MSSFIVMGVSGCGKSTIASMLATRTGGQLLDADDFHPAENKAKMAAGIPLTDEDRWPWLAALNCALKSHAGSGRPTFVACSALKQSYRDLLSTGLPELRFIYLKGSKELIGSRIAARKDHFMPVALLDSQFAALEEPTDAIIVSIDDTVEAIVAKVLSQAGLSAE